MRLAALALLVSVACDAAPRVYDRACDVASRRSDRGGVYCSTADAGLAPMTLRVAYNMPLSVSLPNPHMDPLGIGECHFVASGAGNGCDTVCLKGDGGPLCDGTGGLIDPHTATCINTPWGKALDITAASQAPTCDSAWLRSELSADGGAGQAGPETHYALTNLRTTGSPTNAVNFIFDFYAGVGGSNYRQLVNDITGAYEGAAGLWCSPASDRNLTQPVGGWALSWL